MLAIWTKSPGPVLEGNGLRLRLPQRRDFGPWQQIRAESRSFLKPFEPKWSELDLTRNTFDNRVRRTTRDGKAGSEYSFFLFDVSTSDEVLLGGVTLSNIRYRAACHGNLGYWMGVNYAGRGHMSNAVGLCLPFAFQTLNLRRIHAACVPENTPSRRVLEKNGFLEEGFAELYLQIDGKWRDHVLYGLTSQRFDAIKGQSAQ